MPEDVSEVDVHEMSRLGQHNVVIVTIFDSQKVRSDAVARARANEALDCLSIGPCLSKPQPSHQLDIVFLFCTQNG